MTATERLVAELREANGKRTGGKWYIEDSEIRVDLSPSTTGEGIADCTVQVCDLPWINKQLDYKASNRQFIVIAANSMDKLLRIIEVQREALEDCTNGDLASSEGIYKSEIARLALAKSDRIAEGKE